MSTDQVRQILGEPLIYYRRNEYFTNVVSRNSVDVEPNNACWAYSGDGALRKYANPIWSPNFTWYLFAVCVKDGVVDTKVVEHSYD